MRDVFIPSVGNWKYLHCREDGIAFRRIEKSCLVDHGRRTENAAFLIDALCKRGKPKKKKQNASDPHTL